MTQLPRNEYPRPDFQRKDWLCLNGEWDFSIGDQTLSQKIRVPFACETVLSGIHDVGFHKVVFYRKTFLLPDSMRGKKILLHFGAVDYACDLWVNGKFIRSHSGGQTGFSADITESVYQDKSNQIELKVTDDYSDLEMPRGKQFWEKTSRSIFYTRTTGIWQTVWLEAVDRFYLERCYITPDYDNRCVRFDYVLSDTASWVEFTIRFGEVKVTRVRVSAAGRKGSVTVQLDQTRIGAWNFQDDMAWTPEHPHLFDVTVCVYKDQVETDRVETYFGMRKVSIENGKFLLNNREYYQKLVLDQGYWENSLLTAPTDADLIKDIQLTKAMGFNGVRKHQKVEDPRYLYHADHLGLLVWGEIGSAYVYSRDYAHRMYAEWQEVLERDYNHPSIVVWTPLNESWGVPEIKVDLAQQAHCNALRNMIRSFDTSRMIVDNDGWEHTAGDLLTIHDYTVSGDRLKEHYQSQDSILHLNPGGKSLFADGYGYCGQPILVTEFGGIKYAPNSVHENSWGYTESHSAAGYTAKLAELFGALQASAVLQGYCYTQLTDVEQEENGLLTSQRHAKIPLETIRKINSGQLEVVN